MKREILAAMLPLLMPFALNADENLEELYAFIDEHSPKYHPMHPENDLVGMPKYNSRVVRSDPRIIVVTDDDLQEMKLTGHGTSDALYEVETATIYLSERVDLSTAYGKSVLLHEIVHHVQHQMNLDAIACGYSFIEGDAYAIQAEYLWQHSDMALTAIRELSIVRGIQGEHCLLDLIMNGERKAR